MSKQRCQQETTSTQFLDWLAYLEWDVNSFHREDWFLAKIAKEVRRTILKDPNKDLKWSSFLIKFTSKKESKKVDKMKAAMTMKRRILSMFKVNSGKT